MKQLLHAIDEMDLDSLRESIDIECKLALGFNGKGELPRSLWESYSAFANTNGGIIVLGVKENPDGSFTVQGIPNSEQLKQDFFNLVNNPQKVSVNLIQDSDVISKNINGKTVLFIGVERARREDRPVFINGNPLGNTFARQHGGDYKIPDYQIKRLLADQSYESFDDEILVNFGLNDLDPQTIKGYRQHYKNANPDAPSNLLDDQEFLTSINAFRHDRATGQLGLTKAGLLMFGKHHHIWEVFPYYCVDYHEKDDNNEARWLDRVVPDLTWSGNLFDFFFKVIRKLTADLKVPFVLDGIFRRDDTPVHQAIREALVNTLVHADYNDRLSVLITKYPNRFVFRNPGLMRIPLEIATQGGYSDCRNRTLHQMFRLIRIGEQIGSGIPKVINSWKNQHWQVPEFKELVQPGFHTILTLKMTDYLPQEVMSHLQELLGEKFQRLSADERIILALSSLEHGVDHAYLANYLSCHPADLSKMLQRLTRQKLLNSTGGRYAIYTLPMIGDNSSSIGDNNTPLIGDNNPSIGDNTSLTKKNGSSQRYTKQHKEHKKALLIGDNTPKTEQKVALIGDNNTPLIGDKEVPRDSLGRTIDTSLQHHAYLIDQLEDLTPAYKKELLSIAQPAREKTRLSAVDMEKIILSICSQQYVSLSALSELLNRREDSLRQQYLSGLLKKKALLLAYPHHRRHKRQAYCTAPQ
ncbi:RNA-binding domain-containing protein [Pelistega europaea]|uniref:RNA-binding domain-containing protein n=1 Tax=Pelistega europaea TaxID=106147 RepID=UPI001C0FB132